jgi:chaperonin GroES
MLKLEYKITLDKDTIESPNLAPLFPEDDLKAIGQYVHAAYQADVESREPWLRRNTAALDLAMQVQKDKNFPWPNASNVAFPLITIAALQFHSRAYPAIIPGANPVQVRVIGPDPNGERCAKAEKVSKYMSWQLMEQDADWEEQVDRALLYVPIAGTGWKKTYWSGSKEYNESDFVPATDLVLNYWARSVTDCPTKTHIIPMSRNTMHSRILEGVFCDVREDEWYKSDAPQPPQTAASAAKDNRIGTTVPQPSEATPFICLEQHCCLDLDQDGYEEPYIVTFEQDTQTVLRIVCRFDRESDIERNANKEIIRIHGTEYFTKIPFLPSPDGGIMDIGFGTLLGPLNESVNSTINQLLDAGTLANTAGGFLGRGAKIRGGVYNFSPFQWNRVDSTGDDLKKSILPLPTREPSNVLFQLLSLLINYTEKISGAVDVTTGGNPGQNTPASTFQGMVTQGQKVYAAIFKRIWRSMKEEFKKLYLLNGRFLPSEGVLFAGTTNYISKADFLDDPGSVVPVADPDVLSDEAKLSQASALLGLSKGNPAYDQDEVQVTMLRALKIPNIEKVYKGIKNAPPPPPDVKIQVEQLKLQHRGLELALKRQEFIASLMEQRRLNEAKIVEMYAQAAFLETQAGGVKAGNQIKAFQAIIDGMKVYNDGLAMQIQQQQQQAQQQPGDQEDATAASEDQGAGSGGDISGG